LAVRLLATSIFFLLLEVVEYVVRCVEALGPRALVGLDPVVASF